MKNTFARRLFTPLIPLYRLALACREERLRRGLEKVRRLRYPVVSIGNLSVGGAGKTPLAITLARALQQRGWRVDVLSRGYGRQNRHCARVNPAGSAAEFGDEPLLIARATGLPVYVAPQRYGAGLLAESQMPPAAKALHLLDDGFQHRQLARAVDILLLNRRDWQDSLLPAGNLREPLAAARRASIIAIPADETELEGELRVWGWQGPVWRLRRRMEVPRVSGPVAAFCGIARPEQFFAGLEAGGLALALRRAFADHYAYTREALEKLLAAARQAGATALVTTEKDRVRMGELTATFPVSMPLITAQLRVEIAGEDAALEELLRLIDPLRPPSL